MAFDELSRPASLRYGVAVGSAALALVVTHLFWPVFRGVPFLAFFLAIFVSGWFGGGGASLVTTLLGSLGAAFVLEPLRASDRVGALRTALFVATGLLASYLQADLWESKRQRRALLELETANRRRAEEAEERTRRALDAITDGFCTIDRGLALTFVNAEAERILGRPREELLGKKVLGLFELAPENLGALDRAINRREAVRSELFYPPFGRWFAAHLYPMPDGVAAVFRDITDRKRAEQEQERLYADAQESIRARDDFLSVAGHELKTPLTTLGLEVETLARLSRQEGKREQLGERVERIRRAVQRLGRLVDELLDSSRIGAGRLVLEREPLDLTVLARQVAHRFSEELDRSGSRLEFRGDAPVTGAWDRARVEQVLGNLLSNAIKYGAGRTIRMEVRSENGNAFVVVRDQGIGISVEDQARIFRRFERAVSKSHFGGLGLGLWIVRQIAEAHGGSIEVASEVGEGATFQVRLPGDPPPA